MEIKEFAMRRFNDNAVTTKNERYFLTECFANAIIAFLIKHGYQITPKGEKNDVQE